MENKIKKIMADIFEINISKISEDSSPETIDAWDSLKQMNLVIAIEEECDITFSPDEIANLTSLKNIIKIISLKR